MTGPIKAGDLCRVVEGLGREKSPNLKKQVTVGHRIYGDHGDDSRFGPIHTCVGEGVVQLDENGQHVVKGWADFPVAWLRKINPDGSLQDEYVADESPLVLES